MIAASLLWPRRDGVPACAYALPGTDAAWAGSAPARGRAVAHEATPLPRPSARRMSAGMADLIYNQLHLFPAAIDMGLRTSEIKYDALCWNAFSTPQTLAVSRLAYSGIEDTLADGSLIAACAETAFSITITMSGDPIIEAELGVSCPTSRAAMPIAGRRGVAWSFLPDSGLVERWEWMTFALTLWDYGDERIPLRVAPRVSVEAGYTLDPAESGYLETMAYDMGQSRFCLPHFERQTPGVIAAAADNAALTDRILCDVGPGQWRPGDMGLLWQDALTSEIFVAGSVDADGLTLDAVLTTAFSGPCLVLPCSNARLTEARRTDHGYAVSDFTAAFQLSGAPRDAVPETVSQYEGHDVWELPLPLESDGLARAFSLPNITLDNGIGVVKTYHASSTAAQRQPVTLELSGREAIAEARGLLLRRQGRCRPFWTSTRRGDLEVVAAYSGNGSASLHVRHWASDYLGKKADGLRARLRLELLDGTCLHRRIIGVSRLDAATDVLLLDAPLVGGLVAADQFCRVSFMSLYRLASDVVEWTWRKPDRASAAFQIEEVGA